MKIIKRGAEAILYTIKNGETMVKERIKKGYRIEELDKKIRRMRTRREVKLMEKAYRMKVKVPEIFNYDDFKISMRWIEGKTVKDVLNNMQKTKRIDAYKKIGKSIAMLHSSGIIHGDLTTSNMILEKGDVFFIDFGLGKNSTRIEDQATDLYLLYEALKSTHFTVLEEAWSMILKTYKQNYLNADDVLKRIEKIKTRRRYK
jgi:Kae1-associated kinase Bud32